LNIQTHTPFPLLLGLLIAALGISVAYALYYFRSDKNEFSSLQRAILASFRGLSVFIASIFLLSLFVEVIKSYREKPIVVVGIDNSESMATGTNPSTEKISDFVSEITSKLGDKFDLHFMTFGAEVKKSTECAFNEKISDYTGFIESVQNNFYNLNVGALVIVGDGIYNMGRNPVAVAESFNAPIYTLGLGDTTIIPDQYIVDVSHNNSVFKGNSFPIEVEINFNDFHFDSTHLEITLGNKTVVSERIQIPQSNWFFSKQYSIIAENAGVLPVVVRLKDAPNEVNVQNNRYSFSIVVHENKQKVLMLTAAPHPDLGAFTESLKKLANFDVTTMISQNFKGDISDYDMVVLNQLPSPNESLTAVIEQIKQKKKAALFIVGPKTSISALNNLQLHFSLQPTVSEQESMAYFSSSFSLFSTPTDLRIKSEAYPPLLTFFTKYTIEPGYSVLAYQKINGIEMDYPLIATGDFNGHKLGVIFGEGIWRWRIYEFQNFENSNTFNALTANLFSYLCLKENKEQFRIRFKSIVDEINPVKIEAQVLNDLFEPVSAAEVKLQLKNPAGSELNYIFDADSWGYQLNLGYLSPGEYSFVAETSVGEKKFEKSGQFSVQEIHLEQQNLRANHGMLKQLANLTAGRFYAGINSNALSDELQKHQQIRVVEHKQNSIHELIDWKWLFFLLLTILTMEWFLRKFWGSY
jgi:hypothetical protein